MLQKRARHASVDFTEPAKKQKINSKYNIEDIDSTRYSDENILLIAQVAVYLTKSLLALGAENNLQDVIHSRGLSTEAGKYRQSWLYISKKRQVSQVDTDNSSDFPNFFFHDVNAEYNTDKSNKIARLAACAVMARTGACDQHAYVVATILRHLLPEGMPINICGMRNTQTNEDFSHTFVVIGHILEEGNRINAQVLDAIRHNNTLVAADAWTTQGGALKLKNFWLREGAYDFETKNINYKLHVDHTLFSDGKDHLIKRVIKQQELLARSQGYRSEPIDVTQDGYGFNRYNLDELYNFMSLLTKMQRYDAKRLSGYYNNNDDMFSCDKMTSGFYQDIKQVESTLIKLVNTTPNLKSLLESIDEGVDELGIDIRLNSMPNN